MNVIRIHASTQPPGMSKAHRLQRVCKPVLLSILAVTLLQACDGGSSATRKQQKGVGDSYLFVSVPNFYFGTRDVGSNVSQDIRITNQGGDIYPIRSLTIDGANAEEFATEMYSNITLNPSEAVDLNISFAPITEGRKSAELNIDFDTIVQVSDADNQNEQHYYRARALEDGKQYQASLDAYDSYIDGKPVTINKRRAAIKAPVIKESALYGTGEDFELYLSAVNARENGDMDLAMADLDALLLLHKDSYIADDALYLRGYIQLTDQQDYAAARLTMQALRKQYPDTTYYDTALYSEALSHQQMGDYDLARSIFEDLKYRHTGMDTLGITLPKDNVMSRLWFGRADAALDAMDVG